MSFNVFVLLYCHVWEESCQNKESFPSFFVTCFAQGLNVTSHGEVHNAQTLLGF